MQDSIFGSERQGAQTEETMSWQKETQRTNDEMYLRKFATLLSYLHLYLDIKTQISDCSLKFLSYSTQNHSESKTDTF